MSDAFSCAICYVDALPLSERVMLPCCGRESSSIQFCRTCLEVLASSLGGAGRCPTCSKYFRLQGGTAIAAEELAQCGICRQLRPGVVQHGALLLCELCVLGLQQRLAYECEACHRRQVIPHPMFTYQPAPLEFGTTTWACHQGCGAYTRWRVVDATLVPPQLAPESWGRRDEWLAAVRDASLARRGSAGGAPPGVNGRAAQTCSIS
jgi:hypothetical protein